MKNNRLIIEQLDKRFIALNEFQKYSVASEGWIKTIRKALRMSLRQLAERLSVSAQNVKKLEQGEAEGSISLKKLKEMAEALDMKLVYSFVPKDGTLDKLIEKKAVQKAKEIVMRTSNTMKLEDQGNSDERLQKAIAQRAEMIKQELPKYLWD